MAQQAKKSAVIPPEAEPVRLLGRLGRAVVAIVTIIPEEFDAVRNQGKFKDLVPGTSFWFQKQVATEGQNKPVYDVVLARTSTSSTTPCMDLISDLTEQLRPEFLILCGIAGGIKGRWGSELGAVIVADHVDSYEVRRLVDGKQQKKNLALDHPSYFLQQTISQRVKTKGDWAKAIPVPRPVAGEPAAFDGNLIAGEKLFGDGANAYQKAILEEHSTAIAVDMESYGMARGVYAARRTRHYNLQYLAVRCISDHANVRGNQKLRNKWRLYAASAAAAFTIEAAKQILLCVTSD